MNKSYFIYLQSQDGYASKLVLTLTGGYHD